MKNFHLELNDIRCSFTIINTTLILLFGISIAWFGLIIAIVGIIKDITVDKKVNGLIMHSANAVLNIYFLTLLF